MRVWATASRGLNESGLLDMYFLSVYQIENTILQRENTRKQKLRPLPQTNTFVTHSGRAFQIRRGHMEVWERVFETCGCSEQDVSRRRRRWLSKRPLKTSHWHCQIRKQILEDVGSSFRYHIFARRIRCPNQSRVGREQYGRFRRTK